jgi:phosphatidylethanolamine/phosphatidyl-N-methylethanolamine N-methyltransferase
LLVARKTLCSPAQHDQSTSEDGMRYWMECSAFFRQFRQQYDTTGSVLPSSRALARALTRPMRQHAGPRRILEVGPGTGAVTREIVRQLRPDDRLDIVEINGSFVELIRRRFEEEPSFQIRTHQTRLIHAPLQEVEGQAVYNFMISGIPLNNFAPPLVEEIFRGYRRLLRPDGTLSYFEYATLRDLKRSLAVGAERARLTALSELLEEKIRRFQVAEELVMFNVPPAVARHFRFGPGDL